jgi:hypothetical protein
VTDPAFETDTAATDTALTGLMILADLRRDLHARGLQAAVAVVDEHAAATIALLAPGQVLTVDGGHYLLRTTEPAADSPAPPAGPELFGHVSYHGDFENAYRRSDGDETGWRVPERLILAREIAEQHLDAADQAIGDYIRDRQVPETDLDTDQPITGDLVTPPDLGEQHD